MDDFGSRNKKSHAIAVEAVKNVVCVNGCGALDGGTTCVEIEKWQIDFRHLTAPAR